MVTPRHIFETFNSKQYDCPDRCIVCQGPFGHSEERIEITNTIPQGRADAIARLHLTCAPQFLENPTEYRYYNEVRRP
jgi:uncharacterized protein YydD (DUF2326 family)